MSSLYVCYYLDWSDVEHLVSVERTVAAADGVAMRLRDKPDMRESGYYTVAVGESVNNSKKRIVFTTGLGAA